MNRSSITPVFFAFLLWSFPQTSIAAGKLGKELFEAVQFADVPQIQALIAKGADVNFMENGRPLLGWASQAGDVTVVKELLKAGANPNIPDEGFGHTPLIRAIETQQLPTIRELLKAKANPNAKSKDGKTCLMFAIESHKPQVVQALIAMGADVKAVEPDGNSPALVAAQDGLPESFEALRILGKAGANMNASNIIYTPLIYAIQQGNQELVKTLLDAGASPDAKSNSDETPLVAALNTPEIFSLLLERKADPNLKSSNETPLIKAVRDNNAEAVTALLAVGADRELKDEQGMTPLEIAKQNFQNDLVQLLETKQHEGSDSQGAGNHASIKCDIADAARKQMEVHGKLQEQVNAGKMDSEIFRTFNEDTKEFGRLLTEDPTAACKLLEELRGKYGLSS